MNLICAVEVTITGRVQGVCFRHETQQEAQKQGVSGHVMNMPDRSVQALFQGEQENIDAMLAWCRKGATFSEVKGVDTRPVSVDPGIERFEIKY